MAYTNVTDDDPLGGTQSNDIEFIPLGIIL